MTAPLVPLPLLADPNAYRACGWDLLADADRRAYWLDLFRGHFPKLLDEARREHQDRGEPVDGKIQAPRGSFFGYLDALAIDPTCLGPLDILIICRAREQVLRAVGIADAYRLAKAEQNDAALQDLPQVLDDLDAKDGVERWRAITRNVFAGNIYDLGATKTVDMFGPGGERPDMTQVRDQLKDRPWLIDDADAWLADSAASKWQKAVLLVDNAGPDIVLGMLPLARELLRAGARVVLAANTYPSLNDVTLDELIPLVDTAAADDDVLRGALDAGTLTLLPTGNGLPLIDLTHVDPRLAKVSANADLLVLEGMGRAIESNLDARFTCDTLKIAMVKDQGVADALGGELFDLVLRYERG
jgi:type II pantothenate kinase